MTVVVGLTDLPLERVRRGKVRDVYAVDADRLLLVASDRVSAFDVVMNELVPHKGAVLTQITAWWLRQFEGDLAHHMLSATPARSCARFRRSRRTARCLRGARCSAVARKSFQWNASCAATSRIGVEGVQGFRHPCGREAAGRHDGERPF